MIFKILSNNFYFGFLLRAISGFLSNFIVLMHLDKGSIATFYFAITTYTFIYSFFDFRASQLVNKYAKKSVSLEKLHSTIQTQFFVFFVVLFFLLIFSAELTILSIYVCLISCQQLIDHYVRINGLNKLYNYLSLIVIFDPILRFLLFTYYDYSLEKLGLIICIIPMMVFVISCFIIRFQFRTKHYRIVFFHIGYSLRYYFNNIFFQTYEYLIRYFLNLHFPAVLADIYAIEKLFSLLQRLRTASKALWIKNAIRNYLNKESNLKLFIIMAAIFSAAFVVNLSFVVFTNIKTLDYSYFVLFFVCEVSWGLYYFVSVGLPFARYSKFVVKLTFIVKIIEGLLLFILTRFFDDILAMYFLSRIFGVLIQSLFTDIIVKKSQPVTD